MKQAVWSEPYPVNSLVLNSLRRLGLVGLVRILQDVAWNHAAHLGHGYDDMIRQDTIWVLTRQKLWMRTWPAWGGQVVVRTWVRPITGPVAYRDCQIVHGDAVIGEATSVWLTLDRHSRRPARLALGDTRPDTRADGGITLEPDRIAVRDGLDPVATIHVRAGDLDLNGHVNNAVYAQWCLDTLPPADHAAPPLTGYEVCFLAESGLDDDVVIERGGLAGGGGFHFQGRRGRDGRPVFTARLTMAPADPAAG